MPYRTLWIILGVLAGLWIAYGLWETYLLFRGLLDLLRSPQRLILG